MTSYNRNNIVQTYQENALALVQSLIIKSNYSAVAMNKEVRARHGEGSVNYEDPASWKYYMNLAGEYHFTDTPIQVVSLDTRDVIDFTKENLKYHSATRDAYQQGTRFHMRLLMEYPHQEFLINCILRPSDKQLAIRAKDGAILAYQTNLVEPNETTLISDLERFSQSMVRRWYVEAFALSDAYYPTVFYAMMSFFLVSKVLALRSVRIKTDEVHSFHLNEHLASHQYLDRYLPYLTREQALWVYRNIEYLERNAGHTQNFDDLLTNLLDKRMIPLAEYNILSTTDMGESGYPEVKAKRVTLTRAQMANAVDKIPIADLYELEKPSAPGNRRFYAGSEKEVTERLETQNISFSKTKDLESNMIDMSNAVPDPYEEVLMRQLVHMTWAGLYDVQVDFQDPVTSVSYSLMTQDAVMYLWYLTYKSMRLEFDHLPLVLSVKHQLHPKPTVQSLKDGIWPNMRELEGLAEELWSGLPDLSQCRSVKQFNTLATKIYDQCTRHWLILSNTHGMNERGVTDQMVHKLFGVTACKFGDDNETVEQWRVRNNLPHYDYTYEQAQNLIREIFSRATGYSIDPTRSIRHVQKALVGMFMALSSYSIQILPKINDRALLLRATLDRRMGDLAALGKATYKRRGGIHQESAQGKGSDLIHVPSSPRYEGQLTARSKGDVFSHENRSWLSMESHGRYIGRRTFKQRDNVMWIKIKDPLTNQFKFVESSEGDQILPEDYQPRPRHYQGTPA